VEYNPVMNLSRPVAALLFLSLLFLSLLLLSHFAIAQTSVNVAVSNSVDTTSGINGAFQLFMATSFQPAEWDDQFFADFPSATTPLTRLETQHSRIQALSEDVPETAPGVWDFTRLNGMMVPIQTSADHSPEFQIAVAPSFLDASNGNMIQNPANVQAFADYATNLLQYYNLGGFDVGGQHFQSPSPYPIEWWGIFNEPNGNGLTTQQYVDLYNAVVPQMAATDPNAKFVAIELSDYGTQVAEYVPTFVSQVTAHVDVVATHFYSTCNQADTDATLLMSVPGFASDVREIYADLATNPALVNVPVWVTENNVNADYNLGNGISACNGTPFTTDTRGTSAFFASWRPYVFSQLAKAGAQALYHWDFDADQQYGEVNQTTDQIYLSYWVDSYLARFFPTPPGGQILQTTVSGPTVESLGVRYPDGSVSLLVSEIAAGNIYDNNGPGLPVNVTVDVSALGSSFTNITEVLLDANTDPTNGPTETSLPVASQIQIPLGGYGVALLRLTTAPPAVTAAGVANAASYQSGAVAPGELVTIFGTGMGPAALSYGQASYPTVLDNLAAGMRVYFDNTPAPVIYTSAQQVSVVVPYEVTGQTSTVMQLEYLGQQSAPVTLPVVTAAPGIFSDNASGTGQGAILNQDFSVNSASNPASPGDVVSIYATGEGNPQGTYSTGVLPTGASASDSTVTASIGGVAAQVTYAGAAPYEVNGVLQVNVQIPQSTPSGNVAVQIRIGNAASQAGITLAVR
jgi:uncharacterized protein (TIGR03437 family)